MNFVVGVILAVFRNEEVAFKALIKFSEKSELESLLNSELPRLNLFFLQLGRLLFLYDLELANHFKNEGISASFYAAAWFITLFTSSLDQIVNDGELNERLL